LSSFSRRMSQAERAWPSRIQSKQFLNLLHYYSYGVVMLIRLDLEGGVCVKNCLHHTLMLLG